MVSVKLFKFLTREALKLSMVYLDCKQFLLSISSHKPTNTARLNFEGGNTVSPGFLTPLVIWAI